MGNRTNIAQYMLCVLTLPGLCFENLWARGPSRPAGNQR